MAIDESRHHRSAPGVYLPRIGTREITYLRVTSNSGDDTICDSQRRRS